MSQTIGILHKEFPFGGAETATIRLAEGLSTRGYSVIVFCTDYKKELENATQARNYRVQLLPDSADINSSRNIQFLTESLPKFSIHLLCVAYNGFLPLMQKLKGTTGLHVIYLQHGQPFWELQPRLDATARKGFMKIRVACLDRPKERLFHYYTRRWKRVYCGLYQACDTYVTLHPAYSLEIRKAIGCDGGKFVSIPNMTGPTKPSTAGKKKHLLYCGRMSHSDKRVDRLLRIWKHIQNKVPDWELILTGDGPERPRLEKMADRLGLKRVRFEGWQKDMSAHYQEASVVCLTSTFESFGLCLVEGMDYGCIPVAFACSAGVEDIIQGYGILVPPFQLKPYADALVRLMTDENLRQTLRKRSAEGAARFHPENIIPLWDKLFQSILNGQTIINPLKP